MTAQELPIDLYAVTHLADTQIDDNFATVHRTGFTMISPDSDVNAYLMQECIRLFPQNKGYFNHRYTKTKIPEIVDKYRIAIYEQ